MRNEDDRKISENVSYKQGFIAKIKCR